MKVEAAMSSDTKRQANNRSTKKMIVFALMLVFTLMVISLSYVDFKMAPSSEEAGILQRGFPYPMIKSGPFYAGYVGVLAREGGREYLLNAEGAFGQPRIYLPGMLANLVFYSGLVGAVCWLTTIWKPLFLSATDKLKQAGIVPKSLIVVWQSFL